MFDPALYDPRQDPAVVQAARMGEGQTLLPFPDLGQAATRLSALADGYAAIRNDMLRGQMASDVLLLGTTAAAVINPLFSGAREATLALTASGAVLGASRIYLAPGTRATAYQAGYNALACAASVADDLRAAERRMPAEIQSALGTLLGEAASMPAATTSLTAAVGAGRTALGSLVAARTLVQAAPDSLSSFARTTIRTTATRASTGTLNFAEALAAINAIAKPAATAGGASPPAAAAGPARRSLPGRGGRDPEELALSITRIAAEAERYSQAVNDAWGRLTGCAIASNS